MTGANIGCVHQLPDASGMKHEVVIQKGHVVNFGAPLEQMIRLAGATVREVGTVNKTTTAQIEHALSPNTAAAMFVVSHHTSQFGFVHLNEFVALCHRYNVPVIVDAAAQDHQIDRLVASGADLIVLSVQKYLSGPTGGIVCGRRDLVDAVYLQNQGIGRGIPDVPQLGHCPNYFPEKGRGICTRPFKVSTLQSNPSSNRWANSA